MQPVLTHDDAIQLVGIQIRTKPETAQVDIFPVVQRYFQQNIAALIPNRKNPGTTFCVYTEYENDHTGPYTYFIGEAVTALSVLPKELATHLIPPQTYAKFTTPTGAFPEVLINAWKTIWAIPDRLLGGRRCYQSDFEIYDERAADPLHEKVVIDLYIGIAPAL